MFFAIAGLCMLPVPCSNPTLLPIEAKKPVYSMQGNLKFARLLVSERSEG